jgi:hypothetical protein
MMELVMISTTHRLLIAAAVLATFASPGLAQGTGAGPVGQQCSKDIKTFCAGLRHGSAEIRACLEANRQKVSPACRRALDGTGGGRNFLRY